MQYAVLERAEELESAGGVNKPGIALVPVADLLDHDPRRHVAWHTGPCGTRPFHFITLAPVKQVYSSLCIPEGFVYCPPGAHASLSFPKSCLLFRQASKTRRCAV